MTAWAPIWSALARLIGSGSDTTSEALHVVQHAGERLGQCGFEWMHRLGKAIDLVAIDQRVLSKAARAPWLAGHTSGRVLVVADVVVAAPARPAFAAATQTSHRDLVPRRQRLDNTRAHADHLARK